MYLLLWVNQQTYTANEKQDKGSSNFNMHGLALNKGLNIKYDTIKDPQHMISNW